MPQRSLTKLLSLRLPNLSPSIPHTHTHAQMWYTRTLTTHTCACVRSRGKSVYSDSLYSLAPSRFASSFCLISWNLRTVSGCACARVCVCVFATACVCSDCNCRRVMSLAPGLSQANTTASGNQKRISRRKCVCRDHNFILNSVAPASYLPPLATRLT